jgi:AAA domain
MAGHKVSISDLRALVELLGDVPLLKRKVPAPRGGDGGTPPPIAPVARASGVGVDVEARLRAMVYQGPGDAGVNETYKAVIPSLLRRSWHPDEVVQHLVDTALAMAAEIGASGWTRLAEERRVRASVLSALNNLLLADYDPAASTIPSWLPGEFHLQWFQAVRDGGRPRFACDPAGQFRVEDRRYHSRDGGTRGDTPPSKPLFSSEFLGGHETPLGKCPPCPPYFDTSGARAPGPQEAPRRLRFPLVPFAGLRPGPEPLYLVDELIPVAGLVDVWGKAKCCKSFWTLDLMLHVAMGWEYRDRYVQQGAVVYCAFEGGHGYKKRAEALRRHYNIPEDADVPLYVLAGRANLITDHTQLIVELREQLGEERPVAVVLDTLNRSLVGSESKDTDMSNYVRAAEAIRDAFGCVIIIVHHCGHDETRPRGHTSLPAAVDAQLAVTRAGDIVTVTVEMMRDGAEDTQVTSAVVPIEVGQDQNGKVLTSCIVIPSDAPSANTRGWPKYLSPFHTALLKAIRHHGQTYQLEPGQMPVQAVSLERVREQFNASYVATGETKEQQAGARKKAFRRSVDAAQANGLIRAATLSDGTTLIWPTDAGGYA